MSDLVIQLQVTHPLVVDQHHDKPPIYDTEYHNVNTILSNICEILSYQQGIQFFIAGFGDDAWPVDIRTDLVCALEELNSINASISENNYHFAFELYEQGVERTLHFTEEGGLVSVMCTSDTHWQPNPVKIHLTKKDVKEMFYRLNVDFCDVATAVCPKLTSHHWLKEWSTVR